MNSENFTPIRPQEVILHTNKRTNEYVNNEHKQLHYPPLCQAQ